MRSKYAQPMSPRTQMFSQTPSGDDEKHMFEEGFTQLAYNVMTGKFPDLMSEIVTFKILDIDVDKGMGIGAFILQHGQDPLYVPAIMVNNQIKPLDMFYHKKLNVFLPLTKDWLDEVIQLTLEELGETVPTPKTLRRDVDIRHVMIPPTTGRYAYAGLKEPLNMDADLLQMFKHLQSAKTEKVASLNLIPLLQKSNNFVKEAFAKILMKNQKLAMQASEFYGIDNLCGALQKKASPTTSTGGALYVVSKDKPADVFKEVFGSKAPEAYQKALKDGYAAKDTRKTKNIAVETQTPSALTEVNQPGFYRLFMRSGDVKKALVIPEPKSLYSIDYDEPIDTNSGKRRFPDKHKARDGHDNLIIFSDGSYKKYYGMIVGEPLYTREGVESLFDKIHRRTSSDTPTNQTKGVFIAVHGKDIRSTEPFTIEKKYQDSNDVERIETDSGTQIFRDKSMGQRFHTPSGTKFTYVPKDSVFVRLGELVEDSMISNPKEIERIHQEHMAKVGAVRVTIKNAGANQFSFNGDCAVSFHEAIKQAALECDIPVSVAEDIVKRASQIPNGRVNWWVTAATNLQKLAQSPMVDPGAGGQMPPGADGMPQQPPAPPSPPSPLDIAIGEAQTQIQQQMSDLQQQQTALQDKVQTIMQVQQRAMEIAQGGQAAIAQGAPPMPAPGQLPPQGGQPGGGMPGPAPQQTMPGMEAAGMSPGGGAMMRTESPSSMEIEQQINPQFLEQAGELQDANVFDAAAVASLAHAQSFQGMVVDYIPVLERALDNIGRMLLSLWMQEVDLRESIGMETYTDLEDRLRSTFEGLGDLILKVNRNAIVLQTTKGKVT